MDLRTVARRVQETLREDDVVARLGGDEFVVLLSDVPDEADVGAIARKLLRALDQPYTINGHECTVTASIGVATFPSPRVDSTDDLFARADEALYRAKSSGRNQVRT